MVKMNNKPTSSININERRQNPVDDSDSDGDVSGASSSSTLKDMSTRDNNVVNLCDSDSESETNDHRNIVEEEMHTDEEDDQEMEEIELNHDDEDETEEVEQKRKERARREDVWFPKSIEEIENSTKIYPNLSDNPLKEHDRVNIDNFTIIQVLGTGAYGKVFLVRKNDGIDKGTLYAMKVLKKSVVISKKKTAEHTKTERQVLEKVRHKPFLAGMHYAFTDECNLYIILDYVCGGELFTHLYHREKFSEKEVKIYIAELIIALEQLHEIGVIYRDIKLENVLIDKDGHIVLTDFGLSRQLAPGERAMSYCGTMEYMAPEIVKVELYGGHDFLADWWSVGVLLVELLTGASPFAIAEGANQEEIVNRIVKEEPQINGTSHSANCMDLIKRLLDKDPNKRIASGKTKSAEIKKHPFFKSINWTKLKNKQYVPAIKPKIDNELDTQNFSDEFTSLPVVNSPAKIPDNSHCFFRGFSYTGSEFCKPEEEVIDELDSKEEVEISFEETDEISQIPDVSEKYQITKTKINSGSFAECYKAFCFENNENCAAKAMTYVNYQPAEVECLRKLNHQHIVKFYDVVKTSSFIYLVMEFLEGGELYDFVRNSPLERLEEETSKNIVRQIASAIEYMHKNNYLHRDIKPENIMFTDDKHDCVKLIDFGFSSYIEDGEPFISDPRFTLDYAPPEIINDIEKNQSLYCKGNDIWSLGTVIYTMVVGHPPFRHKEGENDEDTVKERILVCDYDKNETWDELSPLVKDLILRTLELDHINRLSASDILQHDWLTQIPTEQLYEEQPLNEEWEVHSEISAGDMASIISMEDEEETEVVTIPVEDEDNVLDTEEIPEDVQSAEENNNLKNDSKSDDDDEDELSLLETVIENILEEEEDWPGFESDDFTEQAKKLAELEIVNPLSNFVKKIKKTTNVLPNNHNIPIKKRHNYRKSPEEPAQALKEIEIPNNIDVEERDIVGFESNYYLMKLTPEELMSQSENYLSRKPGKERLHFTDFKSNVPVNIYKAKIKRLIKPKNKTNINSNGSKGLRKRREEIDLNRMAPSPRKTRGKLEQPINKKQSVKKGGEFYISQSLVLPPRKTRHSAGKQRGTRSSSKDEVDENPRFTSIQKSDKKIALVKPLKKVETRGRKRKTNDDPGATKKKQCLKSPQTTIGDLKEDNDQENYSLHSPRIRILEKVTY